MLGLHASEHRLLRPCHLRAIPVLGLGKDRQQDDPPSRSDPVRDPNCLAAQIEPQLAQLAVKLFGVRLGEQDSSLDQQIDVERCMTEFAARERQDIPAMVSRRPCRTTIRLT